jgi:hypothetical protein
MSELPYVHRADAEANAVAEANLAQARSKGITVKREWDRYAPQPLITVYEGSHITYAGIFDLVDHPYRLVYPDGRKVYVSEPYCDLASEHGREALAELVAKVGTLWKVTTGKPSLYFPGHTQPIWIERPENWGLLISNPTTAEEKREFLTARGWTKVGSAYTHPDYPHNQHSLVAALRKARRKDAEHRYDREEGSLPRPLEPINLGAVMRQLDEDDQAIAEEPTWGNWRYHPSRGTLEYQATPPGRWWYEISLARCNTSAQVLDWTFQLMGKSLVVDAEVVHDFLRAIQWLLNPQGTLCSFGGDHKIDARKVARARHRAALAGSGRNTA